MQQILMKILSHIGFHDSAVGRPRGVTRVFTWEYPQKSGQLCPSYLICGCQNEQADHLPRRIAIANSWHSLNVEGKKVTEVC